MNAGRAWRAFLIFLALVVALETILVVLLLRGLADQAEDNRATVCSIGSFLTTAPIIQREGQDDRSFTAGLLTTRAFLADLRELECEGLADPRGSPVTVEEINAQLERIGDELERLRDEREERRRRQAAAIAEELAAGASVDRLLEPAEQADPPAEGSTPGPGPRGSESPPPDVDVDPPPNPGPTPEPPPGPPPGGEEPGNGALGQVDKAIDGGQAAANGIVDGTQDELGDVLGPP